jgi:hypothetical protein
VHVEPSPEVLEIASQFSEFDDEDSVLIARLIQLVAAVPRSVQDEVGQKLAALPRPTTQAELRGRVEAVIAYIYNASSESGFAVAIGVTETSLRPGFDAEPTDAGRATWSG